MVAVRVVTPAVIVSAEPPPRQVCALGLLICVRPHLIGRTPGLPSPVHMLFVVLRGSSSVAVISIAGSKRLETHGALVTSSTVARSINGRALAGDRVGVFAELVANTESETPTLSLQVRSFLAHGSIVGAAAEAERRGKSAASTIYLLMLAAVIHELLLLGLLLIYLLRVRSSLSSSNFDGNIAMERRHIAVRPSLASVVSFVPRGLIPSLIKLLTPPPFLLSLILLVPACAEA